MKKIFILLFFFILFSVFSYAQQNPFLSSSNNETETQNEKQSIQSRGPNSNLYNSPFMKKVKNKQKQLQDMISSFFTEYKENNKKSVFMKFILFSFLYGVLHVLGPGHRKILLFSYFISKPAKWKHGMLAGFMTAVLHAISAILLVGGLYIITEKMLFRRFNDINPVMETISYSLIILIGVYLIIHEILNLFKKNKNDKTTGNNPDTIIFVIASGMVPCPGAATIMIFAFAVGTPLIGIYSVLSMSLGMAMVLSLIPLLAIFLQNKLFPLVSRWKSKAASYIHSVLSILTAVFLVLFGLFFLV